MGGTTSYIPVHGVGAQEVVDAEAALPFLGFALLLLVLLFLFLGWWRHADGTRLPPPLPGYSVREITSVPPSGQWIPRSDWSARSGSPGREQGRHGHRSDSPDRGHRDGRRHGHRDRDRRRDHRGKSPDSPKLWSHGIAGPRRRGGRRGWGGGWDQWGEWDNQRDVLGPEPWINRDDEPLAVEDRGVRQGATGLAGLAALAGEGGVGGVGGLRGLGGLGALGARDYEDRVWQNRVDTLLTLENLGNRIVPQVALGPRKRPGGVEPSYEAAARLYAASERSRGVTGLTRMRGGGVRDEAGAAATAGALALRDWRRVARLDPATGPTARSASPSVPLLLPPGTQDTAPAAPLGFRATPFKSNCRVGPGRLFARPSGQGTAQGPGAARGQPGPAAQRGLGVRARGGLMMAVPRTATLPQPPTPVPAAQVTGSGDRALALRALSLRTPWVGRGQTRRVQPHGPECENACPGHVVPRLTGRKGQGDRRGARCSGCTLRCPKKCKTCIHRCEHKRVCRRLCCNEYEEIPVLWAPRDDPSATLGITLQTLRGPLRVYAPSGPISQCTFANYILRLGRSARRQHGMDLLGWVLHAYHQIYYTDNQAALTSLRFALLRDESIFGFLDLLLLIDSAMERELAMAQSHANTEGVWLRRTEFERYLAGSRSAWVAATNLTTLLGEFLALVRRLMAAPTPRELPIEDVRLFLERVHGAVRDNMLRIINALCIQPTRRIQDGRVCDARGRLPTVPKLPRELPGPLERTAPDVDVWREPSLFPGPAELAAARRRDEDRSARRRDEPRHRDRDRDRDRDRTRDREEPRRRDRGPSAASTTRGQSGRRTRSVPPRVSSRVGVAPAEASADTKTSASATETAAAAASAPGTSDMASGSTDAIPLVPGPQGTAEQTGTSGTSSGAAPSVAAASAPGSPETTGSARVGRVTQRAKARDPGIATRSRHSRSGRRSHSESRSRNKEPCCSDCRDGKSCSGSSRKKDVGSGNCCSDAADRDTDRDARGADSDAEDKRWRRDFADAVFFDRATDNNIVSLWARAVGGYEQVFNGATLNAMWTQYLALEGALAAAELLMLEEIHWPLRPDTLGAAQQAYRFEVMVLGPCGFHYVLAPRFPPTVMNIWVVSPPPCRKDHCGMLLRRAHREWRGQAFRSVVGGLCRGRASPGPGGGPARPAGRGRLLGPRPPVPPCVAPLGPPFPPLICPRRCERRCAPDSCVCRCPGVCVCNRIVGQCQCPCGPDRPCECPCKTRCVCVFQCQCGAAEACICVLRCRCRCLDTCVCECRGGCVCAFPCQCPCAPGKCECRCSKGCMCRGRREHCQCQCAPGRCSCRCRERCQCKVRGPRSEGWVCGPLGCRGDLPREDAIRGRRDDGRFRAEPRAREEGADTREGKDSDPVARERRQDRHRDARLQEPYYPVVRGPYGPCGPGQCTPGTGAGTGVPCGCGSPSCQGCRWGDDNRDCGCPEGSRPGACGEGSCSTSSLGRCGTPWGQCADCDDPRCLDRPRDRGCEPVVEFDCCKRSRVGTVWLVDNPVDLADISEINLYTWGQVGELIRRTRPGGYEDWRLPSYRQLQILMTNKNLSIAQADGFGLDTEDVAAPRETDEDFLRRLGFTTDANRTVRDFGMLTRFWIDDQRIAAIDMQASDTLRRLVLYRPTCALVASVFLVRPYCLAPQLCNDTCALVPQEPLRAKPCGPKPCPVETCEPCDSTRASLGPCPCDPRDAWRSSM